MMFTASLMVLLMAHANHPHHFHAPLADLSVDACGVMVAPGDVTTITPVFESRAVVSGAYRLAVTARARGSVSVVTQANQFSGRSLSAGQVIVGPAQAYDIVFDVVSADGVTLCGLEITYPQDVAAQGEGPDRMQEAGHV